MWYMGRCAHLTQAKGNSFTTGTWTNARQEACVKEVVRLVDISVPIHPPFPGLKKQVI